MVSFFVSVDFASKMVHMSCLTRHFCHTIHDSSPLFSFFFFCFLDIQFLANMSNTNKCVCVCWQILPVAHTKMEADEVMHDIINVVTCYRGNVVSISGAG